MNDTLELVPVEAPAKPNAPLTPAAAAARAVVPLRQAALARFSAAELHLTDMRDRYALVQWDTSTPKGLDEAKAARQELRQDGRYLVQKLVEKTKTELNELKADVAAEGDRLIALIAGEEERAHKAITEAEEKAKAERDRKRKAEEGLSVIHGYVAMAKGKTAAALERGIAYVQRLDVSVETWGADFAPKAVAARDQTVRELQELHTRAVAAEAAAEDERRRQAHMQDLMSELQGIGQQVLIAEQGRAGVRIGGTIECIRETLAETEAWELPAEHWGAMLPAAQAAKAGAVTHIRALLERAEARAAAAQAAAGAPPENEPAPQPAAPADKPVDDLTARARAAFSDDLEPEPEEQDSPRQESGAQTDPHATGNGNMAHNTDDAAPVGGLAEGEAAAPAAASPGSCTDDSSASADPPAGEAAAPASVDRATPTLSVSDINARFGEGLTMTRAFIEGVLGVPASGVGPRKNPLWSENDLVSIAVGLRDIAHEIAIGER